MKYCWSLFCVTVFVGLLLAQDNEEFRATWVITWEYIDAGQSVANNQATIRKILDQHAQAHLNAVLWQARQSGTAYYPSRYEPWGYYAGGKEPGFDPLAYAISEAHKRGMEFHAWFNVFACSSVEPGTPAAEHPEWVCLDQLDRPMTSSRALSPGLTSVRAYLTQVALEIVRNYDIDGLHLDYVRWNEYTSTMLQGQLGKMPSENRMLDGMISEAQIHEINTQSQSRYLWDVEHPYRSGIPSGFNNWEDWWRWSVTEFVRTLHDSIQAVKPWVRLSAAVLGKYNWSDWQGYGTVYQDGALWFNQGYVDQLTPMHYHWVTGPEFYNMLAGGGSMCWGTYLQEGINAGRLFSAGPGSYILSDRKLWNNHDQIVNKCREIPWVDGFQFFSYGSWNDQEYFPVAGNTIFPRWTKVRAAKLFSQALPQAPTLALQAIDSLNYHLTVAPPAAVKSPQRYAIYRSSDSDLDVATDEIIQLCFGDSTFQFVDHFSGLQDFNGAYYYFATTLDRFWNESLPSNAATSAPIPSFPPTIIATLPLANDTVNIATPFELTFSKTMNPATVEPAIMVTPPIIISQMIWSNGNKTLKILTSNRLRFATQYTFQLAATAQDVNGKLLDGNGDGRGGDAFGFNFHTLAKDVIGPKILASNPDYQAVTDSFRIEDVVSVVFDELVASTTLNQNSLALLQHENAVKFAWLHSIVDARSILTLQPSAALLPLTDYVVQLKSDITDTAGNSIGNTQVLKFHTASRSPVETKVIDDFTSPGDWKAPNFSGSTVGIIAAGCDFNYSVTQYLPATKVRKSAILRYKWDQAATEFLLREYLAGGKPRDVVFDTSYVLQCYVFGDNSHNLLRFCVDEAMGSNNWPNHEVSTWITIDWYGWRLLEWTLADPTQVGTWIGNGKLDGTGYRIDSYQLTHVPGAAISGTIFFDDFRVVKKAARPSLVADTTPWMPSQFQLFQNYPNPFNPGTQISFEIPRPGQVTLIVYDVLGRNIATLVNQVLAAGRHEAQFQADALPSGIYWYQLSSLDGIQTKSMLLLK
ncbi:family 10 glycosylhydrolase [candidate division KSB1 bacterium]|nr:family 10 glycosylhydrolase [candidate division KSB1 bacterium]